MNVFVLQLVAMITMFCDHLADPFLDNNLVLRCIGRFAFPIYAFLLAEGFRHMKNNKPKIEQHLGNLVVLAIISEFSYDLLEVRTFSFEKIFASQSAIITLLLAFLGMIAIENWKNKPIWMWSAIFLTAMMSYMMKSNYKFAGVLMVYAFYYYLNHMEKKSYIQRLGMLLAIFVCYIPIYHWARYDYCEWGTFVEKLIGNNTWWYLTHILVAVLLAMYTGELGFYSKKFKRVYKVFYPVHLFIMGVIFHLMLYGGIIE